MNDINILVVDDEPLMLSALESNLKHNGYAPICVKSGKEALKILESRQIDLILSDCVIPEMDGTELLRIVREQYDNIPFVILTGHGSLEHAAESVRNGADGYVMKPFRFETVCKKINRVLNFHHNHRNNRNPNGSLNELNIQRLIQELQIYQIELEIQNENLRNAQIENTALTNKYTDLYDFAPVGYFILDQKGMILDTNLTGADMLGIERKYLIKRPFSHFITPDFQNIFYNSRKQAFKTGSAQTCELKFVKKDGNIFYAQSDSIAVKDDKGDFTQMRVAISDITLIKEAEDALRKLNAELEQRVTKRTAELSAANAELIKDKAELREMNTALKVLLEKRNQDKTEIEEKVLFNVNELVTPYLEKLMNSNLGENQRIWAEIVHTNLDEIASSFLHKLSHAYLKLTPAEIQVANMVRQGRTTKDIADMLNLSERTIEFHRNSIRKKLGISKQKVNLKTFLMSLDNNEK